MSWWNPVDWWNGTVGSAVGSVTSAVQNFVMGAIQSAVNLVENDIQDVSRWAEGAATDLYLGIRQVESEAANDFAAAVHWTENEVAQAVSESERLFWEAEQAAQAGLNAVEGYAVQLWRTAERDAAAALRQLETWARQGFDAVYAWVQRQISAVYHAVYDAIRRDFINPIERVLQPVIKAMDWILWFAEHPFALVHDVEHDVIQWGEHLPDEVARLVRGHQMAEGFDAVARLLGG